MNRKLSDQQIHATGQALKGQGSSLTARSLQDELFRRYGARGKTHRIARAVRELNAVAVIPTAAEVDLNQLQEELTAMRQRAELAEVREASHLRRWANEIDTLRQEIKALRQQGNRAVVDRGEYERVCLQLEVAWRQISTLEEQLIQATDGKP